MFENLTSEQANLEDRTARDLQEAHIEFAQRIKEVMSRALEELQGSELAQLEEKTEWDFEFWTQTGGWGGDPLRTSASVSHFVNWYVKDKETERQLRKLAQKIDTLLLLLGQDYQEYQEYCRQYEDLNRRSPSAEVSELRKGVVSGWRGVEKAFDEERDYPG